MSNKDIQRGYTKDTLTPAPPFVEVMLDKPRRLRFDAFAGERFETLRGHRMTLLAVMLTIEMDPEHLANPLSLAAQQAGKSRIQFMSQYSILADVLAAGLLHEEDLTRKEVMNLIAKYEDDGGDVLNGLWPAIVEALQNSRMIQCLLKQAGEINQKLADMQEGGAEGKADGAEDPPESQSDESLSPNGATATG